MVLFGTKVAAVQHMWDQELNHYCLAFLRIILTSPNFMVSIFRKCRCIQKSVLFLISSEFLTIQFTWNKSSVVYFLFTWHQVISLIHWKVALYNFSFFFFPCPSFYFLIYPKAWGFKWYFIFEDLHKLKIVI